MTWWLGYGEYHAPSVRCHTDRPGSECVNYGNIGSRPLPPGALDSALEQE